MKKIEDRVDKISVVFRYPNAKGLFVEVPGFKPGGAPIQMYSLATELAKDPRFDVYFWVEGEVPEDRIEGVKLISLPTLIQHGVPILSRCINNARKKDFESYFRNSVCIFTVSDKKLFPVYQDLIHALGGKTLYRVASNVDVQPEFRHDDGDDVFTQAMLKADGIIAQTEYQKEILDKRFHKNAIIVKSGFRGEKYTPVLKDCVLWVGQSVSIKRPWVVFEMARRFPQENFVVIMPIVDKNLAMALMDGATSITNLEVIEYVGPREIQSYYNRAKLVLNTSVYEGFPNTLHQASIGKAPYISLSWNPDRYLDANEIGASAENCIEKYVEIIDNFLKNEEVRVRFGENASQNFYKSHQISAVVEDLKLAIQNIAMIES